MNLEGHPTTLRRPWCRGDALVLQSLWLALTLLSIAMLAFLQTLPPTKLTPLRPTTRPSSPPARLATLQPPQPPKPKAQRPPTPKAPPKPKTSPPKAQGPKPKAPKRPKAQKNTPKSFSLLTGGRQRRTVSAGPARPTRSTGQTRPQRLSVATGSRTSSRAAAAMAEVARPKVGDTRVDTVIGARQFGPSPSCLSKITRQIVEAYRRGCKAGQRGAGAWRVDCRTHTLKRAGAVFVCPRGVCASASIRARLTHQPRAWWRRVCP